MTRGSCGGPFKQKALKGTLRIVATPCLRASKGADSYPVDAAAASNNVGGNGSVHFLSGTSETPQAGHTRGCFSLLLLLLLLNADGRSVLKTLPI